MGELCSTCAENAEKESINTNRKRGKDKRKRAHSHSSDTSMDGQKRHKDSYSEGPNESTRRALRGGGSRPTTEEDDDDENSGAGRNRRKNRKRGEKRRVRDSKESGDDDGSSNEISLDLDRVIMSIYKGLSEFLVTMPSKTKMTLWKRSVKKSKKDANLGPHGSTTRLVTFVVIIYVKTLDRKRPTLHTKEVIPHVEPLAQWIHTHFGKLSQDRFKSDKAYLGNMIDQYCDYMDDN